MRATKKSGQPGLSRETIHPFDRTLKRPRKRKRRKVPKLAKGKSTGGRPPWNPSPTDRAVCTALAQVGLPQEELAAHFGVGVEAIVKHFEPELRQSKGVVLAQGLGAVSASLRESGFVRLSAGKYVLSTKGKEYGWTERTEVTGKDGDSFFAGLDLTKLSDQSFEKLGDLLAAAGANI